MIIAGTGHRPDKLGGYDKDAFWKLVYIAEEYIHEYGIFKKGKPTIISGLALGWDMALAQAAIKTKCPLWCYIPFEGQELKWSEEWQKAYRYFLRKAEKIDICSPGGYAAWKMQIRNKRMVDDCNLLLAMYDGSGGGTKNCIDYAKQKDRTIVNLYDRWKNS